MQAQGQEVTPTKEATGDTPPARPTGLQASAEHDSVTLTWTASTDDTVTHYAILRRDRNDDDIGVFKVIDANAGPGHSYTDRSVLAEGSYVYRVKAVSPTGVSQWSSYARADTPAEPEPTPTPTPTVEPTPSPTPERTPDPADLAPSGLSAKAVSGDDGVIEGVALAWNAPAEDAASVTGYEILRAVGDGEMATLVADTGSAGATYTDDTATVVGESYAYRVKALRGEEASQPSDRALAVIPKVTVQPSEPTIAERQSADTEVPADWSLIPSGLGAGDRFRLVFLSSTIRNGSSTDIADYNTFVQTAAANGHADIQSHSSTFRAVGSTEAVDARDNTSTTYTDDNKGVAIYWLAGAKVANDYEDFYDDSWDDEANAKDESGNDRSTTGSSNQPFTGSYYHGTEFILPANVFGAGSYALGRPEVWVGHPNFSASSTGPLDSTYLDRASQSDNRPLYGLSGVFVVPGVPDGSVTGDFELDPGNGDPRGIWGNEDTIWVVNDGDGAGNKVFAYDRSGGFHDPNQDITLSSDNDSPRGIFADGETMWVADQGGRVHAYRISAGETYGEPVDSAGGDLNQLDAWSRHQGEASRAGVWSDGSTMWVVEWVTERVQAYSVDSSGALTGRVPASDFALAPDYAEPRGMWSDGATAWVLDGAKDHLFAYRLTSDGLGDRLLALEIRPGNRNEDPWGIWSDGETMWVTDEDDYKLYAYAVPGPPGGGVVDATLDRVWRDSEASLRPDEQPNLADVTVKIENPASASKKVALGYRTGSGTAQTVEQTTTGTEVTFNLTWLSTAARYHLTVSIDDGPDVAIGEFLVLSDNEVTRRRLKRKLVETHEADYPWLRETYNWMRRDGLRVNSRSIDQVFTPSFHHVAIPLRSKRFSIGAWRRGVSIYAHELAHVYTLSIGRLPEDTQFVGMGWLHHRQVAGDGTLYDGTTPCEVEELYADAVMYVTVGGFTGKWTGCSTTSEPPPEETLRTVRSILDHRIPEWFDETYGTAGLPYDTSELDGYEEMYDLEAVWSTVISLDPDLRNPPTFALQHAFGGLCTLNGVAGSLWYYGPDDPRYIRNPWRAGGCVPQAPPVNATAGDAVEWDPPAYDGGVNIDKYRVEWKDAEQDFHTSRSAEVTDRSFRHADLALGSSVRVTAHNKNGWGDPTTVTTRDGVFWSGFMSVGTDESRFGFQNLLGYEFGTLSRATITVGDVDNTVYQILRLPDGALWLLLDQKIASDFVLYAGDTGFTKSAATGTTQFAWYLYEWPDSGLSWQTSDRIAVRLEVVPNEPVGVSIDPTELTVIEGDATGASYAVVLDSQPTADVTVTISGYDGTDVTLSNDSLTFTTENWETPQTVTVSAATDDDAAQDAAVTLIHTVGGAEEYQVVNASSVTVTITEADRAGVSIAPTTLTAPEGGSSSYEVVLTTQPSADVTIDISGYAGTDVTLSNGSLTFTAVNWETPQTVTVSAAQDDDAAADDAVVLAHAVNGTGEYATVTAASVTVTIDEDDSAGVSIDSTELTVTEGDVTGASYTVVLDSQPTAEVTVTISGYAGTDVSLSDTSLTFTAANWETPQTVTVSAAQDDDAAQDAAVVLAHAVNGTGEYAAVTAASVTVTIVETDTSTLSVSAARAAEDAGHVVFEVAISAASDQAVKVDYATSDGTATAGQDYTGTSGALIFPASSVASQTVSVPVLDDTMDEAEEETFTLTLSQAVAAVLAGGGETLAVTGTITDDDDPQVTASFGQSAYTVAEGATVEVTVSLSGDPEREVTILVDKTEDGASPDDYSGVPGSLSFAPGETSKSFTFTANDDRIDDDGERVDLAFATLPDGVSAGGVTSSATVTNTDDDTAGVTIEPTELTVTEGGGGGYTVVLDSQPTAEVTVTISGHDGTDVSVAPATLTFTADNWETAQTVTVTAGEDEDAAQDQAVSLSHTVSGTEEYQAVTADSLTVTLEEDDTAGVTIDSTTLTVAEGSSGAYTVVLDTRPTADVTVTINGHSGTAIAPSHTALTFTSSNWNIAQTVTLTARDVDTTTEVTLSHAVTGSGEYGTVTAHDVVVTVLAIAEENQDPNRVEVTISFADADYDVREGTDNVNVELLLSTAQDSAVDIPIIVSSQSTAGDEDYSGVPTTVTFAQDQTSASFQVQPLVDLEDENDEQVVLVFGTLPEGISAGDFDQTTVTILDAVRISFDASSYEATEGGADVVVTVQLNEPAPYDMTVPLTAEGRNGADESDWSGVPDNVVFNTGDSSKSFTVIAVDDTVEDDEMVELGFGTLPGGLIAEDPATATLTIMNQENGQPTGDSCDRAIWCATLTFGETDRAVLTHENGMIRSFNWGGRWDHRGRSEGANITSNKFTYEDTEYTIAVISTSGTVPFPQLSKFFLGFDQYKSVPDEETYSQWTLYVGDAAFPFSEERLIPPHWFKWRHPDAYFIEPGATVELRIEANVELEKESRPPARYLTVVPESFDGANMALELLWEWPSFDGAEDVVFKDLDDHTGYRMEWKKAGDGWDESDSELLERSDWDQTVGMSTWLSHILDLDEGVE